MAVGVEIKRGARAGKIIEPKAGIVCPFVREESEGTKNLIGRNLGDCAASEGVIKVEGVESELIVSGFGLVDSGEVESDVV